MKKVYVAISSLAALLAMTTLASAQAVCAVAIIFAAGYIGAHENRELTPKEAMTCGLSYLADKQDTANAAAEPKKAKVKHARMNKRKARTDAPKAE